MKTIDTYGSRIREVVGANLSSPCYICNGSSDKAVFCHDSEGSQVYVMSLCSRCIRVYGVKMDVPEDEEATPEIPDIDPYRPGVSIDTSF